MSSNQTLNHQNLIEIFFSFEMVVNGLGFFINMTGLFGLFRCKQESNQKMVLMQLSIVEIVIILNCFIISPTMLHAYLSKTSLDTFSAVHYTATIELALTMNIMTVDRLICILNPLKYKLRVTKSRLAITILGSWVSSVIVVITNHFLREAGNIIFSTIAASGVFFLSIST